VFTNGAAGAALALIGAPRISAAGSVAGCFLLQPHTSSAVAKTT